MEQVNQEGSISMNDTELVKCSCGSDRFKHLINIRKVSSLFTRTGKDEYVPVPIFVCVKCDAQWERPKLIT
jgi:hypothetical protein